MEAKGSTFLKVTGILMIVFGAIALVVSIIAILGIAALAAFNDGTYDMTMLYVGGVSRLSVRLLSLLQVLSALSTQNFRTRQIHVLYGALLLRLCVLQAKLSA